MAKSYDLPPERKELAVRSICAPHQRYVPQLSYTGLEPLLLLFKSTV